MKTIYTIELWCREGSYQNLKVAWETLGITLKVKENFSACNTLEDVYTSIVRLYYDVLQLQTALN